jgi:hypothetical protein
MFVQKGAVAFIALYVYGIENIGPMFPKSFVYMCRKFLNQDSLSSHARVCFLEIKIEIVSLCRL